MEALKVTSLPSGSSVKVVYLGVGKVDGKNVEFEVKVGDKVIFNKFNGNEFKLGNETYTIIKEKDILAIIEK